MAVFVASTHDPHADIRVIWMTPVVQGHLSHDFLVIACYVWISEIQFLISIYTLLKHILPYYFMSLLVSIIFWSFCSFLHWHTVFLLRCINLFWKIIVNTMSAAEIAKIQTQRCESPESIIQSLSHGSFLFLRAQDGPRCSCRQIMEWQHH